jgi:hypothetical protein
MLYLLVRCVRYNRHGFILGHHWGYHGLNNRSLKVKLHRVYALFCPALLTGDFIKHGGTFGSDPQHTTISSEQQHVIGHEPNAQVIIGLTHMLLIISV